MPRLQEYTLYTTDARGVDAEVALPGQSMGMCVHTIAGPYHHVIRGAHTVYLSGSQEALRDKGQTEHMVDLVSQLGKNLLLCVVSIEQWYKRASSADCFTLLHASTFAVLHPRSAGHTLATIPPPVSPKRQATTQLALRAY